MLRKHLVHAKTLFPLVEDKTVYKIPWSDPDCKEQDSLEITFARKNEKHERDVRFSWTQQPLFSEHSNKTGHCSDWENNKCIDRDSHWYTRRKVKEAV